MNFFQNVVRKISTKTARLRNNRAGLLIVGLVAGTVVVGLLLVSECSATLPIVSDLKIIIQDALPGTEEFGLSKKQLVRNIEAVELLIAQCMSENGFEYIAADYRTIRRGMTSDKSLPGMGEGTFVKRYGFGISTLYTGRGPQLSELRTPAQIGLGEKNIEIFRNLSKADQVAYNRTLFGEHSDATFAVALETEDFSRTGGCTRQAIAQVFKPEQLKATYRNPKDAMIEKDPRMIAALAKWSERMRAAGFNYSHPIEVDLDIKRRLDAITGGAPIETLSAEARAALRDLQAYEIAACSLAYELENKILDPVDGRIEREMFTGFLK